MTWLLMIIIWLALLGWVAVVWLVMRVFRLCDQLDVANRNAADWHYRCHELQDDLEGSYEAVGRLQGQLKQLAFEKPLYFRDIPMAHNAHIRFVDRSNFIEWGN